MYLIFNMLDGLDVPFATSFLYWINFDKMWTPLYFKTIIEVQLIKFWT